MTRVDVVVPSYNYAHLLPDCIESLYRQEGVMIRALILDDTSTDDTPAVAARLLTRYPGLEYRRHAVNAGHIATYNEGLLEWAAAPYVLLLSADDLLAPGALKRAVDQMERNPEVGMVCGMALLFESAEDIARSPSAKPLRGTGGPDMLIFPTAQLLRQSVVGNPISTPTMVVRTELQKAVGPYARELPHSADMEMWMRFALRGRVAVTRFVQAYKRIHGGNMSKSYPALRDLRQRLEALEYACAREPDTCLRNGLSREYVRRTLAEEAVWLGNAYFDVGDPGAMRECLEFARELWPPIGQSKVWRRTRLKLHLGVRAFEVLRSIAALLRLAKRGDAAPDPRVGPRPGTIQGWWPELESANQ
jgi:glycosyltransferase involved in cell wall biosynthesis